MQVKKCPNCGLLNFDIAIRCDCGFDFKTGKTEHSYLPINEQKTSNKGSKLTLRNILFIIFLLSIASKVSRLLQALPSNDMNNYQNIEQRTTVIPGKQIQQPTPESNLCPDSIVTNWFNKSAEIANNFDYTSQKAKTIWEKQKLVETPKCLKTLQGYWVNYYNYVWRATDYHEKGQDGFAKNWINRAEETFKKLEEESDRLAEKYGWEFK